MTFGFWESQKDFPYTIKKSKKPNLQKTKNAKIPKTKNSTFQKSKSCTNLIFQPLEFPKIQSLETCLVSALPSMVWWSNADDAMLPQEAKELQNSREYRERFQTPLQGSQETPWGSQETPGGSPGTLGGPKEPLRGFRRNPSVGQGGQETSLGVPRNPQPQRCSAAASS